MCVAQVVGRLCGEQLLGVLDTNNYQKAEIRNKYMQVIQGEKTPMIIHKTQIQIYIHLPFTVEDTKDDGEGGRGEISFLGINQYCEGYSVSSLNCGNSTLVERVAVVVVALLVMVLAVVLVVVVVLVLVAVVVVVLPTTTT